MWYKLKRIMMRPNGVEKQVRPSIQPLTYDFTQSDWWWTDTGGFSRDSNWFYRSWTYSDGFIIAPSEIFNHTPKKITINYNKTGASSWTWFIWVSNWSWVTNVFLPPALDNLNWFQMWKDEDHTVSLGTNPMWDVTWIMEIDSSTTNWTVTHKIASLSSVIDTYWTVKATWDVQDFRLRIVNWRNWTWSLHLKSITIEY